MQISNEAKEFLTGVMKREERNTLRIYFAGMG